MRMRTLFRLRSWTPLWLLVGASLTALCLDASGLWINLTPSLPLGLYRSTADEPRPGALVAVCLPETIVQEGRRLGFLPRGRCPGEVQPVVKIVGAVAGQTVTINESGVSVAGRWLQEIAAPIDSKGRPIDSWPVGRHAVPPGRLWLYTPHPSSWDSRYYGPVPVSAVLTTVEPLWTTSL